MVLSKAVCARRPRSRACTSSVALHDEAIGVDFSHSRSPRSPAATLMRDRAAVLQGVQDDARILFEEVTPWPKNATTTSARQMKATTAVEARTLDKADASSARTP